MVKVRAIQVGASILAADFTRLDDEIKRIETAGIDFFHLDIMDGHFVPNITIGPDVVRHIRGVTKLKLDVHLMIRNPLKWIDRFINAGANNLTLHIETISATAFRKGAPLIKSKGIGLGVSLNPATALRKIESLLDLVDFVLIMSVNPGFGGQKFIAKALAKIKSLRKKYNGDIAVDGGINNITAKKVIFAGANILDAGTYIYRSPNPKRAIERLKHPGGSKIG